MIFKNDFCHFQKIFNDRLLTSIYILTWKDNKDIVSVKYKWQNSMYSLSQTRCVNFISVQDKKDLERYASHS